MRAFGGMVSFRVADGEEAAVRVCDRARLFTLGESLGGVESLIEHPGRMTHASAAGSALEVPADLVRLSVGIESVDDLLADLTQALGEEPAGGRGAAARPAPPARIPSPLPRAPWCARRAPASPVTKSSVTKRGQNPVNNFRPGAISQGVANNRPGRPPCG